MVRAAKLRSTSLELWAVYVIWNLTKQITLTHHPSPGSSFMARSLLRARTLCVMSVPLCAMSWRLSHAEGVLAIDFESIRESAGGRTLLSWTLSRQPIHLNQVCESRDWVVPIWLSIGFYYSKFTMSYFSSWSPSLNQIEVSLVR